MVPIRSQQHLKPLTMLALRIGRVKLDLYRRTIFLLTTYVVHLPESRVQCSNQIKVFIYFSVVPWFLYEQICRIFLYRAISYDFCMRFIG